MLHFRIRLVCATLATVVGMGAAAGADTPQRPNVLFIAVDDLNHWVGYLHRNPQTITPNIDRLAEARRAVHAELLRRAELQSFAGRADVRAAPVDHGRLRE